MIVNLIKNNINLGIQTLIMAYNKIDDNPDFKKLYKEVVSLYKKTNLFSHGPFDETYYTLRVYETSKIILKKLNDKNIRRNLVLVSAILHDIGKIKLRSTKLFSKDGFTKSAKYEWYKHSLYSVDIAEKILKKQGYSAEFIDDVLHLVRNHDRRKHKVKNRNIELMVLQDADLISDCGISGFIRPFLFSGMFKQSIIQSAKFIMKEDRISDKINLDVSKKIANKEMKVQRKLAKNILSAVESDLIN